MTRVALVTGATSGLGRAAAVRLAAEGYFVIATGRNADEGARTVAAMGGGVFARQDVTDEAGWADLMAWVEAEHGRLDVLVNSAGVFFARPLDETSLDDFRWLWRTDVESCLLGTKHGMALMARTRTAGSIINISSLAGAIGIEDCAAYCAAKAAVDQLSRLAALEGGGFDPPIRVNALAPGVIMSEMITRAYGDTPEVREFVMAGNALTTAGEAEDVAAGVAYLARARFVTGTVLTIDGGRGVD
jgi:NAD(P)-dependent dehydrogenase (short-subunit alcohol dehydrogenase family)